MKNVVFSRLVWTLFIERPNLSASRGRRLEGLGTHTIRRRLRWPARRRAWRRARFGAAAGCGVRTGYSVTGGGLDPAVVRPRSSVEVFASTPAAAPNDHISHTGRRRADRKRRGLDFPRTGQHRDTRSGNGKRTDGNPCEKTETKRSNGHWSQRERHRLAK